MEMKDFSLRFPENNIIKLNEVSEHIIPINTFIYKPIDEIPLTLKDKLQKIDYNFTIYQLASKREIMLCEFRFPLSNRFYNEIFLKISNQNSCMLIGHKYEYNELNLFKKFIIVNMKNNKVVGRFFLSEKGNFIFNPYAFGYKKLFAYVLIYPVLKFILKSNNIDYRELGGGIENNIYFNDIIYDKKNKRKALYHFVSIVKKHYKHIPCINCHAKFYEIDEILHMSYFDKNVLRVNNLREIKKKTLNELVYMYNNLGDLILVGEGNFICRECAENLIVKEMKRKLEKENSENHNKK